jgi:hypothetical protein
MRQCPWHDCAVEIPDDMFACRPHWFSLTEAERNRIWWAWREYVKEALTLEELRAVQQEVLGERGKA